MTTPPSVRERPRTSGDPSVAALLTWFLPGAGHLYLGRPGFALQAFVVVEGAYLLGLVLSQGMGFEFLHHELRGPLAPALAPEIGNLGGFLWQLRTYAFGPGEPRPWPEWMHEGVALTALSGVLNVCLMSHAHHQALCKRGEARAEGGLGASPALAVLLTWVMPGLGHALQGRRLRAALVCFALVGLLVLGTLLAEGSNLSRERHYYYWGGQFLAGLPALLLEALHGHQRVRGPIPYAEAGLVLASVAGLLNILAMLDVYGWAGGRAQEATSAASPAGEAGAAQ
jgi:hypothetical protein